MPDHRDQSAARDDFGSTHWTMVLAAAGEGIDARAALEKLCETYWLPVYGFVRSRTRNTDDAYELTQEFFANLLEKRTVAVADPARGRFRSFLLTSLKNFLINQHSRRTALKRGGGRIIASLDHDVAESRLRALHAPSRTPEQEFERRWALAILDRVLERLKTEQTAAGRSLEFSLLQPLLIGQPEDAFQTRAARTLGTTNDAIRAAVYRLRKRYRTLLQQEVAQTVGSTEDVAEEVQHLIAAVSL